MRIFQSEEIAIQVESDIPLVRLLVRKRAAELKFGALDLTMILTVASELSRNTLLHGGGGKMTIETVADGERRGLRLAFADHGPGIADVRKAMTDGYSTKRGMGLGMSGSKRLVHEFTVASEPGVGTEITVIRWAG
jgi:serine/threonine-protein kinase RsbT